MSFFRTIFGHLANYEFTPEAEQSPSPSAENVTFSLGVQSQCRARPRLKLPSDNSTPESYDSFLGLCEAAAAERPCIDIFPTVEDGDACSIEKFDAREAMRSPSISLTMLEPVDIFEQREQSSCSDGHGSSVDHVFLPSQSPEAEVADTGCSSGQSEVVVDTAPHHNKVEAEQHRRSEELGCRVHSVKEAEATCWHGGLQGVFAGASAESILSELLTIQQNVEKMKAVIPRLANGGPIDDLGKRRAAATMSAVRLISQLSDAAAAIFPAIQHQEEVPLKSCQAYSLSQPAEGCELPTMSRSSLPSAAERDEKMRDSVLEDICVGLDACSVTPAATTGVSVPASSANPASVSIFPAEVRGKVSAGESEFGSGATENFFTAADPVKSSEFGRRDESEVRRVSIPEFDWRKGLENSPSEQLRTSMGGGCRSLPFEKASFGSARVTTTGGTTGTSTPSEMHNAGFVFGAERGTESDEEDLCQGELEVPAGSYTVMEIRDSEILTEQTYFCNICNKGFKRDANLRMHMRSHGGRCKPSVTLIQSSKTPKMQHMDDGKHIRYSCPVQGCNRNSQHAKFQALKTMLCLKNHYRRSHCAKTLKCSICKSKQFSVVADLKTHEKHCGSDNWLCSCGTSFSRKEKLHGHVSLFEGHHPVKASVS